MDRIEIERLEDGTLSVKTSAISKKNHYSADEFIEMLEDFVGETKSVEKVKHKHQHAHQHQKLHQH